VKPADVAPASRAAFKIAGISWSLIPGIIGAALTDTSAPAFASASIACIRV
jgi:hypothetical protein